MSIATIVATGALSLGAQGEGVRAVQLALAQLGLKLKGTGYFGGATDTAVNAFKFAQQSSESRCLPRIKSRAGFFGMMLRVRRGRAARRSPGISTVPCSRR
jgi:hypothetical protein